MILLIYSETIFRELPLPNLFDTDYRIDLYRDVYRLRKDVFLQLENNAGTWTIRESDLYRIKERNLQQASVAFRDGQVLELITAWDEHIFVVASDAPMALRPMEKYDIARAGEITIGSKEGNVIRYTFMGFISGLHARMERSGNGWVLADYSKNGVFCENQRVARRRTLQFGDHINVFGLHLVFLGEILLVGATCGTLSVEEAGIPHLELPAIGPGEGERKDHVQQYFNRAPRDLPSLHKEVVEIEAPPAPKQEKQKPTYLVIGPAFTMAIPMALGCMMMILASRMSGRSSGTFMYMGLFTAVGAAIIGAVWAVLNLNYSREQQIADEEQRFNAYSNYLLEIAGKLRKYYQHNTDAMHRRYPSASSCVRYNGTSAELWNRNRTHDDFLFQRIGLGDQPFQVEIRIPKERFSLINDSLQERPRAIRDEYQRIRSVPVGIDLAKHPLIGLVGGPGKAGAISLMHTITAGVAATHTYTDVKLVYLFDDSIHEQLADWECVRYLPHLWSEDGRMRYMAGNETEINDILFALANTIRTRAEDGAGQTGKREIFHKPHYLIFVSDPTLLEGELLTKYIYDADSSYGITVCLLVETIDRLPNACEIIIENDNYFKGIRNLLAESEDARIPLQPDVVTRAELEEFGRTLANIRVRETELSSEIPERLGFLEMHGVRRVEELDVAEKWRKNRTYHTLRALVGRRAGGQDCYLDIHEKSHGPHGLVAGTTGSGKSETLQSWMLSLAVSYSPEDVSFFVIDFKGGGMANLFSGLPHLAGQISNLSGNQINRAMISIKSENLRRQRLFAEHGVNHINQYTRLHKEHRAPVPIPHLLIIIDEFAELKREEPDFMQELISVAQVGRSLGVHLILATQKPGGTVDENIQSNAKFRLCLRVQDRQDSMDMLHKPDAAYLTQAGRCYLQVGNDEIFELFQAGYSGAIYSAGADGESGAALLGRTGREDLSGRSARAVPEGAREQETELAVVINHLKQVAAENGYANAPQLWLPVLPQELYFSDPVFGADVERYANGQWPEEQGREVCVRIALCDDPASQMQFPMEVNFTRDGHLAVLGGAASGKSTFLQTLVYAMTTTYTPERLHLYLLDFSSNLLMPFASAPHVGGAVGETDGDRLSMFFHMLTDLMDERRALLRGGSYEHYVQAHGESLPVVMVILDNYVSFREKSADRYEKEIGRILREGSGYGIYLVITASGFGLSELPTRLGDQIRNVIALEQADKFRYMEILRLSRLPILPETNVHGRGLATIGDRVLEFQTALALPAADDFARGSALEKLAVEMDAHWNGLRPRSIPEIPENPVLEQLTSLESYREAIDDPERLPVGWVAEDATLYRMHLRHQYCFTISGKARSGKTNILRLLTIAAAAKGAKVAIMEKKGAFSMLERDAQTLGASYAGDAASMYAFFEELLPEFKRRNQIKQELLLDGCDEDEIYARMRDEQPIFVMIDDLADFIKTAYQPGAGVGEMSAFLENIFEKGQLHNIYFFACLDVEDENLLPAYQLYTLFTGARRGMHTGGNLSSQKIFQFMNVAFSDQSRTQKKGEAMIADDEDESRGIRLVVPLVKQIGEKQMP